MANSASPSTDAKAPPTADDVLQPMASIGDMVTVQLVKPCLLNGDMHPAGEIVHVASQAVVEAGYKAASREAIRAGISQFTKVDAESQAGTIADIAQLLLVNYAGLVVAISNGTSFADVQAAVKDFAPAAKALQDAIGRGDVKFPFMAKGVGNVINDAAQRGTMTTEALNPPVSGK